MLRYVVRRLLYVVLVLWVISAVTFLLFYVAPAHPEHNILPRGASPEALAQIRANLHLDDPIPVQYWHFLTRGPAVEGRPTGLLHWPPNLGYSYHNGEAVLDLILDRLPVTASLAFGAAVLWFLLGIPIGIQAATHPRTLRDRIATGFALTGVSMPTFFLGLLLIYVFAYKLRTELGWELFPYGGYVPLTESPLRWAHHLLLPWLTVALVNAAVYARMTRGALLDVLGEDYIRTARAKGLSERRVVYRHGLRSALTPIVTLAGLDLGALLGGAIVTEQVFGLSGVGDLAVRSVHQGDQSVVVGTVLFASAFIVLANVVIDVGYAMLDARVRYT